MKTVPGGLLAKYQSGDQAITLCVKLTRRDAQVFGVTALDRDIIIGGVTYKALPGVEATDATTAGNLEVDNVDVTSVFTQDGVTPAAVGAGVWDGCAFEVFAVDWTDPAQGIDIIKTGELGDIGHSGIGFKATLVGLTARLQNNVGRVITPLCDATFGDARCGVNKATHTVSNVPVTSVQSQLQITCSSLAQAAGHFNEGDITGVTGANAGIVREIRQHNTGGVLILHEALPFAVAPGDTFNVAKGCSKIASDATGGCLSYNNVINFRGFPDLPGNDALVRRGGQ